MSDSDAGGQQSPAELYKEKLADDEMCRDLEDALQLIREHQKHRDPDPSEFAFQSVDNAVHELQQALAWRKTDLVWDVLLEVDADE